MQLTFGAGYIIGRRTDLANRPPLFFGVTQDWSLDLDQEIVTLLGQFKVAVDAAPGELKLVGKIKWARLQIAMLGDGILGISPSAAANSGTYITGPENRTSIAATTFTVAAGTAFLQDLGVFYHNTAIALTPITAGPAAGQYIPGVAGAGIYTIAAGDQNIAGGLDVFYLQASTTDYQLDVTNQLMGTGPTIELDAYVPYQVQGVNKKFALQLYSTRFNKFPMPFKNKGYMIPEADFVAFANAAGNVARFTLTE